MREKSLEVLSAERRVFKPAEEFQAQANVRSAEVYEEAERDRLEFWSKQAKRLTWFEPWQKVLEWNPPFAQWFVGGKLNASYNCVDRHVQGWRRNKAAIIFEGKCPNLRMSLNLRELEKETGSQSICL